MSSDICAYKKYIVKNINIRKNNIVINNIIFKLP